MEKTKNRAAYMSAAFGLWATGMTVPNPLLAGWLFLCAVGALVFAVKPQWAAIQLWGKKQGALTEDTRNEGGSRPMFDIEGSHFTATDTRTTGNRTALRAKDSKVNLKRWWHRG